MRNLLHEYCMGLDLTKEPEGKLEAFAEANCLPMKRLKVKSSYVTTGKCHFLPRYIHGADATIIGCVYFHLHHSAVTMVEIHTNGIDIPFTTIDEVAAWGEQPIDRLTTEGVKLYSASVSFQLPRRTTESHRVHEFLSTLKGLTHINCPYSIPYLGLCVESSVVVYRGRHFGLGVGYESGHFDAYCISPDRCQLHIRCEPEYQELAAELLGYVAGAIIEEFMPLVIPQDEDKFVSAGRHAKHINLLVSVGAVTRDEGDRLIAEYAETHLIEEAPVTHEMHASDAEEISPGRFELEVEMAKEQQPEPEIKRLPWWKRLFN